MCDAVRTIAPRRLGRIDSPLTPGSRTDDTVDDASLLPLDESLLDPPPSTVRERAGNTAAGIVAAAMLGIGEVLEPEKASAPIEIVGEAPEDEPLIDLDFVLDDLPPL